MAKKLKHLDALQVISRLIVGDFDSHNNPGLDAETNVLPCKFSDLKYLCMFAYCFFVKKLADACGMEYNCGKDILGLFGMCPFD